MKKLLFAISILVLMACEKPILDEVSVGDSPTDANVILHFTQYDQEAFGTRATT